MPNRHKYQHSTFQAKTSIKPYRLARIVIDVAASPAGMPQTGSFVRFEKAEAEKLLFSVRNHAERSELMSFCVHITADGVGSAVNTRIEKFTTTRRARRFLPFATKTLVGYREYKLFARELGDALRRADPRSHSALVEKPLW